MFARFIQGHADLLYLQSRGHANLLSQAVVRRHGARTVMDNDDDEYTVNYPEGLYVHTPCMGLPSAYATVEL